MRRRTLPLLVLTLLQLLHSLCIPPGDGKGGAEEEVQKERPPPGDAPSKKNGPCPSLAGAAGAGQKLARAQVLCTELYFLLLQIPDDKYLLSKRQNLEQQY